LSAGYSGTPLARKLSLKNGKRVWRSSMLREIALPMGLVDVKVCPIDDVWSGLRLVIRKELRSSLH
jgi:hypothetical protein